MFSTTWSSLKELVRPDLKQLTINNSITAPSFNQPTCYIHSFFASHPSQFLIKLNASGDLFDHRDVSVSSWPTPVRVLMTQTFWNALAGSQRTVELRLIIVFGSVHPLHLSLAKTLLQGYVQWHVQRLRLWQSWPWRRRTRTRRWYAHVGQVRGRKKRRRRLTTPANQEEQRCTAQGT